MSRDLRPNAVLLAPILLAFTALPANADIVSIFQGRNIEYLQTGPSTVIPIGTFFGGSAFFPNVGDYDTGTLTYPGAGSPQALSPGTFGGPNVGFQTGFFPDLVSLDAAYPFGTYTYQAFDSVTSTASSSVDVSYTSDAYTADIPMLTAASFNALQGLPAGQALTINFNAFAPDPGANFAAMFFTITDLNTFNTVFSQLFLDPSTTSITIPANTLAPNTLYSYQLDFDDRILGSDSGGLGIPISLAFDVRTDGSFTTSSVPEPSTAIFLALGCLALAAAKWGRL